MLITNVWFGLKYKKDKIHLRYKMFPKCSFSNTYISSGN